MSDHRPSFKSREPRSTSNESGPSRFEGSAVAVRATIAFRQAGKYGSKYRKRPLVWRTIVQQKWLLLMALPGVIFLFVFNYLPMFGIVTAFEEFNVFQGVFHSPWVGWQNIEYFLSSPVSLQIFLNTFILGVVSLVFGFPAPIIFALLLNEIKSTRFRKVVQSISCIPYFISTVIIVGMLHEMADQHGLFNQVGHLFGLPAIQFFAESSWFRPMFVGSGIWQGVGWSAIIYLAALTGVDPELYAAAEIDGANRWHKVIYVTLPGIAPTIMILLILSIGGILGTDYQKVLLMQSPTNLETSQVVGTYVYQTGILNANFGEAAAVGLMLSVLSFMLMICSNWLSRKLTDHSLW